MYGTGLGPHWTNKNPQPIHSSEHLLRYSLFTVAGPYFVHVNFAADTNSNTNIWVLCLGKKSLLPIRKKIEITY
jgi:hypothetical protein